MCNILKKLGEAELEIMQVIWNSKGPHVQLYFKGIAGQEKMAAFHADDFFGQIGRQGVCQL